MTKDLLMGIDMGTSGCRVTLIDTECRFIADGYTEYITHHAQAGWAEQDPSDWFPAFKNSLKIALDKSNMNADQIVALSMDASAHNVVLLDDKNQPLRNTIMWTDQRSVKEVEFLTEHHKDEIFNTTYQMPSPTWSLPQLMWINEHEPDALANASRITFIKDYLRYLLTDTWTTDHVEAQGSMLFDNHNRCWSELICRIGNIPMNLLPPIVKPYDIVGRITPQASALTGLKEGVPVINGSTDTALETYCVGAISENCCVVKIATAGTVNVVSSKPTPNPRALTYSHVIDGLWYTCFGTSSASESLRWYRDVFCESEKREETQGGESVYQKLDREAQSVAPGSDNLVFHPYLMGERSPYWDAKLRASFVGASAHHTRGHFNRSVLEGVAYSIKDNFVRLKNDENVHEVRIVGGGAKSPLWCEILSNVLNRKVLKYRNDDSSYGAALLAGVGAGIFSGHEEAINKGLELQNTFTPDPSAALLYEKQFITYRKIQSVLAEVYHAI